MNRSWRIVKRGALLEAERTILKAPAIVKTFEQTCSEPHKFLRLFQKTDVALPGSGEELLIEGTCELVKEDAIQHVSRAYLTKVLIVLPLSADMF